MEENDLRSLVEEQLALTRRLKDQIRELKERDRAPLAVVGTGLRLPGGLTTPDGYWDFLNGRGNAAREFPEDRVGLRSVYDPRPDRPGTSYVSKAALLDDPAGFDAAFFGISRREAEALDPQQRLMLEVSWEAMERAGIAIRRGERRDAGVFVGIMAAEYTDRLTRGADLEGIDPYYGTGGGHAFAAGRVSYALGLSGPAVSVDTACSSSLVALHYAARSLRRGECRYALVGGANAIFSPELMVSLCRSRALAPDGRSKPFLANADGYGRGEGVGALVLMRLDEAEREGRPVLAVLRGSAVNHDGASSGLTVPNGPAQQEVIRAALADSGLRPEEVSYVEAHGTGTSLGDPIEAGALQEVYGRADRDEPLLVGSVKARLGHLEAASGVAALIKLVLMLRNGAVPAARGPEDGPLNPHIPWDGVNLDVPDRPRPWPTCTPVAGASAFGLSGTNAHALLSAPDPRPHDPALQPDRRELVTVSARDRAALTELVDRVSDHLTGSKHLASACHTLRCGRADFAHRVAATGAGADELVANLRAALAAGRPGDTVGRTVALRLTQDTAALAEAVRSLASALPGLVPGDGSGADPATALSSALTGLGLRTVAEPADALEHAAALEWNGREYPLLATGSDTRAAVFLDALAALYTAGADLDLAALRPPGTPFDPDVPTYAFQRRRYWIDEPRPGTASGTAQAGEEAPGAGGGADRGEITSFLSAELATVLRAEDAVDPSSGFLEVGGDSFTAMTLLTSAEQRFGCELPLDGLDVDATVGALVEDLADRIVEAVKAPSGQEQAA
ncbi:MULTISPECIES: beta-ketoacyl synthase N-terminal-like domain-containing protein [unclassified Nocardiopsis]|uniref:beta-ketoacyl synthase N-terminal-like domain-containing protein n=1 Tax=unclassified Nocardiopsis TaxID=2649073 RepID=UPI0009398000|nr:beta-ketoacyl synthase N-terminal-like domain-containing protein [Nocardiopsis sp. TSRI0078]